MNDITWLKGLLQDELVSEHKVKRTTTGIGTQFSFRILMFLNKKFNKISFLFAVARYPRSLTLRVEDNIEYVTYPWNKGKCGGYIKINPGLEKIPKVTGTTMVRQTKTYIIE